MAEPTGLEPATSSVTGKRSNQLSYGSTMDDVKNERISRSAFLSDAPLRGARPAEATASHE